MPLPTVCPHVSSTVLRSRETTAQLYYATDATTSPATPSSSLRTVIFVVTPDLAEYAIRTLATTLPPPTVFPRSFRVCVVWLTGTSVPSKGCKESVLASCSVASKYH